MSHLDPMHEDPRRRTGGGPVAALLLALAGGAGLMSVGLAGCEDEGPVEETEDAVEEAAEETEDAVDD